jgi:two-component system cell cycle sensor histidine kinase/response regulator CckA
MSKPVVLIVEDDAIARLVFKKIISRLEYEFFEASNGEIGLDVIARNEQITHVFLDLNMPVLDGYGFLHYINSGNRYKDLNIYITTVADEDEFTEIVRSKNIDVSNVRGYNRKPFDMTALAKSIEQSHSRIDK